MRMSYSSESGHSEYAFEGSLVQYVADSPGFDLRARVEMSAPYVERHHTDGTLFHTGMKRRRPSRSMDASTKSFQLSPWIAAFIATNGPGRVNARETT